MPTTFDGSLEPVASVYVKDDGLRSTIDPDDFSGGFGTWSGTSFAAPILAGEIAQQLQLDVLLTNDSAVAVNRAWQAIETLTDVKRSDPQP